MAPRWSWQLGDGACAAACGVGAGPPGGLKVASCGVRHPRCRDAKGPGKPHSDSQVGRHRLGSAKSPDGKEEDQAGSRQRPWMQSSRQNPASVSTCVVIKPSWGQECKAGLTFYTLLEQAPL